MVNQQRLLKWGKTKLDTQIVPDDTPQVVPESQSYASLALAQAGRIVTCHTLLREGGYSCFA